MGRLFSCLRPFTLTVASCLAASPASAEVCDKVLGEWAAPWLVDAPLWAYLAAEVLSPMMLAMLGLAALTLAAPGFRWLSLAGAAICGALSWIFVQEILYPHRIVELAREEGCGGSYLAAAVISPIVVLILLGSFILATRQLRKSAP